MKKFAAIITAAGCNPCVVNGDTMDEVRQKADVQAQSHLRTGKQGVEVGLFSLQAVGLPPKVSVLEWAPVQQTEASAS